MSTNVQILDHHENGNIRAGQPVSQGEAESQDQRGLHEAGREGGAHRHRHHGGGLQGGRARPHQAALQDLQVRL